MSLYDARLFLRSQAFHWAELSCPCGQQEERERERRVEGAGRGVWVQGRHKLPYGAKLSKSQSSIPDGRMDMNGYRWMCVNNLHYSHV